MIIPEGGGYQSALMSADKTDTLTIRVAHDIERLQEEANEQGIRPSILARMLVKRGLQTL